MSDITGVSGTPGSPADQPGDAGGSTPRSSDAGAVSEKRPKKKGGGGSPRGIETMFRTTYRVHMDLTALADSKANIMISINGLILSIILASIAPKIDANTWLLVPTSMVLLSCLGAIIFAVLAARPRVNSRRISLEQVGSGNINLLFFGNYTQLTEDEFVAGMEKLVDQPDLLYSNMMRDLFGIGTVLSRKFSLLRKSYTFFMIGLSVSVVAFIVVFATQSYAP
jgi:hypothetical protein